MTAAMDNAYAIGPAYLRMGKSDLGDVHAGPINSFQPGRQLKVCDGRSQRPGLIATGSMARATVDPTKRLDLTALSTPMLKPLDVDNVGATALATNGLCNLQEHLVLGGLGAAVTEITSEHQPTRVLGIDVPDRCSEYCGTYAYQLREDGLDTDSLRERVGTYC